MVRRKCSLANLFDSSAAVADDDNNRTERSSERERGRESSQRTRARAPHSVKPPRRGDCSSSSSVFEPEWRKRSRFLVVCSRRIFGRFRRNLSSGVSGPCSGLLFVGLGFNPEGKDGNCANSVEKSKSKNREKEINPCVRSRGNGYQNVTEHTTRGSPPETNNRPVRRTSLYIQQERSSTIHPSLAGTCACVNDVGLTCVCLWKYLILDCDLRCSLAHPNPPVPIGAGSYILEVQSRKLPVFTHTLSAFVLRSGSPDAVRIIVF